MELIAEKQTFVVWKSQDKETCIGKYKRSSKSISDDNSDYDLPQTAIVESVAELDISQIAVDEWWDGL